MKRKVMKRRLLGFLLALVLIIGQIAVPSVANAQEAQDTVVLQDADFTGDFWNAGVWTVTPSTWDNVQFEQYTYADNEWLTVGEGQGTTSLKFWMQDAGSFTLYQYVKVPAGVYTVSADFMGEKATVQVVIGEQVSTGTTLSGWNMWDVETATFTVSEDMENAPVGFAVTVDAGGYGYMDSIAIEKVADVDNGTTEGGDGEEGGNGEEGDDGEEGGNGEEGGDGEEGGNGEDGGDITEGDNTISPVGPTLQDADFTGDLWNAGIWTVTPS
ncbi:MAG: hypothetical protein IJY10_00005, partial [Lachnospiraceae bacterium]|nr:hypothetical protein [Lachnospiraceae bacterium]